MDIQLATTDMAISACYPVMRELRPNIIQDTFPQQIQTLRAEGYHLAYLRAEGSVVAVAGFRFGRNLAWGHFLYVDDLVTLANQRSKGYGKALLAWLRQLAADKGCDQLHLDTGVQRKEAQRFYTREGMTLASQHFMYSELKG